MERVQFIHGRGHRGSPATADRCRHVNVCHIPAEYGRRFSCALETVQLAHYICKVPSSRDGKEPEFKSWVRLGLNGHQLWVHPSVKLPLWGAQVQPYHLPGKVPVHGHLWQPNIPVAVLIRCLEEAECVVVWRLLDRS